MFECSQDFNYYKSSIYFKAIWGGGGLIEKGGLFNLEITMVSGLHKELEHKVEKL